MKGTLDSWRLSLLTSCCQNINFRIKCSAGNSLETVIAPSGGWFSSIKISAMTISPFWIRVPCTCQVLIKVFSSQVSPITGYVRLFVWDCRGWNLREMYATGHYSSKSSQWNWNQLRYPGFTNLRRFRLPLHPMWNFRPNSCTSQHGKLNGDLEVWNCMSLSDLASSAWPSSESLSHVLQ